MVALKQGVVAVCQAYEGASLEVLCSLTEGLEHMSRLTYRWALNALYKHKAVGNTLIPFALTVQGDHGLSEKCSIEPPPHYFQQLTFPFQRLCFPSTWGNLSRFLRISTTITVT